MTLPLQDPCLLRTRSHIDALVREGSKTGIKDYIEMKSICMGGIDR